MTKGRYRTSEMTSAPYVHCEDASVVAVLFTFQNTSFNGVYTVLVCTPVDATRSPGPPRVEERE